MKSTQIFYILITPIWIVGLIIINKILGLNYYESNFLFLMIVSVGLQIMVFGLGGIILEEWVGD